MTLRWIKKLLFFYSAIINYLISLPSDVYTILSGYDAYEWPEPIGGGECDDKYGGGLPLPWINDPRPLCGDAPSSKPILTVL